jgi:hypothetical protein
MTAREHLVVTSMDAVMPDIERDSAKLHESCTDGLS